MKFYGSVLTSIVFATACQASRKPASAELQDVAAVQTSLQTLTADGSLTSAEFDTLLREAGNRIDAAEGLVLWRALRQPSPYTVDAETLRYAEDHMTRLSLPAPDAELLQSGKTLGGTIIPDEVKKVLASARLAGAVAYDVREPDPDSPDEGFWSPYPQALPVTNSMAWTYTEITPAALAADMADTTETDRMAGDDGNGSVTYVKDKCLGQRGKIQSEYDEVFHPNIYARGRSCQKWANNCGIMFDGSLHCLPASRRAATSGSLSELILTNPSLARQKHMLWNGHLQASNGVITSIGMSGRIAKRAARNQFAFVDPVPLLKAWGFKLAPGLRTTSEHGETARQFLNHGETATVRGTAP